MTAVLTSSGIRHESPLSSELFSSIAWLKCEGAFPRSVVKSPLSIAETGSVTVARSRPSGFTLIELVVTIMIITILAVTAVSRFSGTQDFDRRGFHDEILAALRYAQKSAIAQRRNVCVAFDTGLVTVTLTTSSTSTFGCDIPLVSPTGSSPFVIRPRSAGSVSYFLTPAAPANLQFDGLGRPSSAKTIQVVGVSQSITVEQETGYVHP